MDTKSKKWKPIVSFAAFALGISMLFGSLPGVLSTVLSGGIFDLLEGDYQNTDAFKREISFYMRVFIDMGTNGENRQSVYSKSNTADTAYSAMPTSRWSEAVTYTYYGTNAINGVIAQEVEPGSGDWSVTEKATTSNQNDSDRLHSYYKNDLNVLYQISYDGKIKYTNIGVEGVSASEYPFSMSFQDGVMSIEKAGQAVMTLGEKYYKEDDPWDVPGYQNRKATTEQKKVTVHLYAAETPARYTFGNNDEAPNTLYYIQRELWMQKDIFTVQCLLLVLGAGLVGLYVGWRKQKSVIDRKLAGRTSKIPFEIKLLILLFAVWGLLYHVTPVYWFREIGYGGFEILRYILPQMIQEAIRNTGWFIFFFWVVYLLANEWRYHGNPWKNNLSHKIAEGMRKNRLLTPVAQRIRKQTLSCLFAGILLLVCALVFFVAFQASGGDAWLLLLSIPTAALAIWSLLAFARGRRMGLEVGEIAEQIKQVRAGNVATPLQLSAKSDLEDVAKELNDIQAGMQEAVSEQVKSERMKVELVTNVSHDIKTPLTSIVSYIDLLKQEEELPEHVKDYIRILDQKSQRLRTMVQDIVEVSKAASGQLPVRLETIDLAKLLRQTLADMAERIETAPVTLRAEIPEAPILIEADGDRLYRVFQNLIQNALQYSLAGSRVYVALREDGRAAVASVKNISAGELISGMDFTERFVRGDESRTDGGSGLGLSIAASFTEACGGGFRIETEADLFTAIVEFSIKA